MMEEYDPEEAIQALVQENQSLTQERDQMKRTMSTSFGLMPSKDPNLIGQQLDSRELIASIERFYQGKYISINDEGEISFKSPKDKSLITLNSFGVSLLMEVVTKYIDKNTILADYKEERIYEILADLGDEINLVMYCNYEKMGLDTAHKKSKYRLIITTTLHLIESAYRRAIEGKTAERLNQSKLVTQSDPLGGPRMPVMNSSSQKNSGFMKFLNPRNWGA